MRFTSVRVHSRARTTRDAPCETRNFTASEFDVDICVETWKVTPCFLQSEMTPQSETMKASTYGVAATIVFSTISISSSNMIEIAAHLSAAARDLGKIGFLEVDSAPRAHVKSAEPEIDGIGACVDRGLKASEVPGWGKNLRTFHGQVLLLFTISTA